MIKGHERKTLSRPKTREGLSENHDKIRPATFSSRGPSGKEGLRRRTVTNLTYMLTMLADAAVKILRTETDSF